MINPIHRVRSKGKELQPEDLVKIRHDLMIIYGWIPIKEFNEIKIPELFELHELVQKEKNIMYTSYQATMGAAGMKKPQINEVFK